MASNCSALGGDGSLDAVCTLRKNATALAAGTLVCGNGSLVVGEDAVLACGGAGCALGISLGANLSVSGGATVAAGALTVLAGGTVRVADSGAISTRGRGDADNPAARGGAAKGQGGGGGHGGKGHACSFPQGGGSAYAWETLAAPGSPGAVGANAAGGSKGGNGGGSLNLTCDALVLEGALDSGGADGEGVGGEDGGGGGAGGSVYVNAHVLSGGGQVRANGGDGQGGGGGGRVALVYSDSRHAEALTATTFGGASDGCAGDGPAAPGTVYLSSDRSLGIDSGGTTPSEVTPMLDFKFDVWDNLVVQGAAIAQAFSPVLVSNQLGVFSDAQLVFKGAGDNEFIVRAPQVDLAAGGAIIVEDASLKMEDVETLSVKDSDLTVQLTSKLATAEGHAQMRPTTWPPLPASPAARGPLSADSLRSSVRADSVVISGDSTVVQANGYLKFEGNSMHDWHVASGTVQADVLVLENYRKVRLEAKADMYAPQQGNGAPNCTGVAACPTTPLEHVCDDFTKADPPPPSSAFYSLLVCDVQEAVLEGDVDVMAALFDLRGEAKLRVLKGGTLSAAGNGCPPAAGTGKGASAGSVVVGPAAGGGAGFGGPGGDGDFNGTVTAGGPVYGGSNSTAGSGFACNLGSGGGSASTQMPAGRGGGVIIVGTPISPAQLEVGGVLTAAGDAGGDALPLAGSAAGLPLPLPADELSASDMPPGGGGGSGGSVLLFLQDASALSDSALVSVAGGAGGADGGGGGGGGRLYVSWMNQTSGGAVQTYPPATLEAIFDARGGNGSDAGGAGQQGAMVAQTCPPGRAGLLCAQCAVGYFKPAWGAAPALCKACVATAAGRALPAGARWARTDGASCVYECVRARARMPSCQTPLEALVSALGGRTGAILTLSASLGVLTAAIALRIWQQRTRAGTEHARLRRRWPLPAASAAKGAAALGGSGVGSSDTPMRGLRRPLLESLVEVMESSGREDHVRGWQARLHFGGSNQPSSPWRLPHVPPAEVAPYVLDLQWMDMAVRVNQVIAWAWWEATLAAALGFLSPVLGGAWLAFRRARRLAKLHEFMDEYDFQCMRSVRARSLLEGMRFGADQRATTAWLDFFSYDGEGALGAMACGPDEVTPTKRIPANKGSAAARAAARSLPSSLSRGGSLSSSMDSPSLGGLGGAGAAGYGGDSDSRDSGRLSQQPEAPSPMLLLALTGDGTLRSPYALELDPLAKTFAEGALTARAEGSEGQLAAWGAAIEGINARLRAVRARDMARTIEPLLHYLHEDVARAFGAAQLTARLACRAHDAVGATPPAGVVVVRDPEEAMFGQQPAGGLGLGGELGGTPPRLALLLQPADGPRQAHAPWRALTAELAARVLPRAGIATRLALGVLAPLRSAATAAVGGDDGALAFGGGGGGNGGARMALVGASLFLAVVVDAGLTLAALYLSWADYRDPVALVVALCLQPPAAIGAPAAGMAALFAPWGRHASHATRGFLMWNASSMLPMAALMVYEAARGAPGGDVLRWLLPLLALLCKLAQAQLGAEYLKAIEHEVLTMQ